ncbi:hypothetical protein F4802DRAFT_589078 [Xylaria palmicola]|nr:hypothetical protein F4802DRAFT_589078 [Xylaria palmicola]
MVAVQLKPLRTADIATTAPKFVSFLHPTETAPYNVIFQLPCLDSAAPSHEGEQQQQQQHLGLHHETALLACQIVANNVFDGYLSLDAQGDNPVPRRTVLLTTSEYYFIVPDDPSYAIVPAFQDWKFPHGRIPDSFPSPKDCQRHDEVESHQASRHSRCIVTDSAYSCQLAHLIPKAHEAWFSKNAMFIALGESNRMRGIDGSGNLCHFRFDIHNALDKFVFALVYKASSWVVHVLQASEDGAWDEFAQEYHNIQVSPQHLAHISRECLFARFALNVFILVKPFLLMAPLKRRVARLVVDPDKNSFVTTISDVSSGELRKEYGGGMSKSASPTKRKRAPDESNTHQSSDAIQAQWSPCTEGDGEGSDEDTWYQDNVANAHQDEVSRDTDSCEDRWYTENVVNVREENERGRTLKRTREMFYGNDLPSSDSSRVKRRIPTPPLSLGGSFAATGHRSPEH